MDSNIRGTNTKCEHTFTQYLHGSPLILTTYLKHRYLVGSVRGQ
jgi:hypothetical protein